MDLEGCTSGFLARSPHSFLVSVSRWGLQRVMKRLQAASCPAIMGPTLQEHLWDPEGQNLTWGPGLGPESPMQIAEQASWTQVGSVSSTPDSLTSLNSIREREGQGNPWCS